MHDYSTYENNLIYENRSSTNNNTGISNTCFYFTQQSLVHFGKTIQRNIKYIIFYLESKIASILLDRNIEMRSSQFPNYYRYGSRLWWCNILHIFRQVSKYNNFVQCHSETSEQDFVYGFSHINCIYVKIYKFICIVTCTEWKYLKLIFIWL